MLPQDGKPHGPLPPGFEYLTAECAQALRQAWARCEQVNQQLPAIARLDPAPDRLARHLASISLRAHNVAYTTCAAANQQQQDAMDAISDDVKSMCRVEVLALFPDIDPDHLTLVCEEGLWQPQGIIEQILNQQEDGRSYPKAPKTSLKRKRDDEDTVSPECAAKKWDNQERRHQRRNVSYFKTSQAILQQFFPQLYMEDLRRTMDQNGRLLYPTFLALHKIVKEWDDSKPAFRKKARIAKSSCNIISEETVDERIRNTYDEGEREALEEFCAARAVQLKEQAEAGKASQKEQVELENLELARTEGNVSDCGCCFTECALNRMVHCDGSILHWFCVDCARMMAETQIGISKHNLDCMSTDGCRGGFSLDQREIFLDKHATTALDRIEAEDYLRRAGIEDLETCPFCPFAMEYPPVQMNREFRCLNEDCNMVSCRACRKETHIPKSCEEAALEEGHSARHTIEEAMSAALIRKCNKCSTPFIKENGCNKMTCIKCRNIQCYICSKSCEYSHFNDAKRGGKAGNCPLFDEQSIEVRHFEEVKTAEAKARKKVLDEYSDIEADFLEIRTSEIVKQDEEQRKKQSMPQPHGRAPPPPPPAPPHHIAGIPAAVRRYLRGNRLHVDVPGNMQQAADVVRVAQRAALEQDPGDPYVPPQPPGPPPARQAAFLPPQNPPVLADPPARNIKEFDMQALLQYDVPIPDLPPDFLRMLSGLDQPEAQRAPGIRQSVSSHASPAGQLPFGYAHEDPYRAGRLAPEMMPLNSNQPGRHGAAFGMPLLPARGGPVVPPPPMNDFFPRHHHDFRDPEPQHLPRYDAGHQRPRPPQPVVWAADQPRGNALEPIGLSSPRSIVIDLTEDNQMGDRNRQRYNFFGDDAHRRGPDWVIPRGGRLPEDF